jgi:hypothetical protein
MGIWLGTLLTESLKNHKVKVDQNYGLICKEVLWQRYYLFLK